MPLWCPCMPGCPTPYPEAHGPPARCSCAPSPPKPRSTCWPGLFAGFEILAVAGTIMAVYGVLYASMENNARRILSYHIVSQVGYMVAGIGIGTAMTINGAVAHAYAHILYKGLLFMGTGCLLYAAGTANLDQLGGLVRRLPWVMILYMVGCGEYFRRAFFQRVHLQDHDHSTGAVEHHHQIIGLLLEVAAVGTFLSVGIKLPYFAFFAKADNPVTLKPIPRNMMVAMAIAAGLCFLQGVYPQMLYRMLPYPVEYVPYDTWKVLQALLLLGFTGLGFILVRRTIRPHAGRNLDVDALYRVIGRGLTAAITRPLAAIDSVWTTVYRVVGLRVLTGVARMAGIFDKQGIDTVVDGTAYTVRNTGRLAVRMQTGRLQDHLAWMMVLALLVFAVVWWVADIGI